MGAPPRPLARRVRPRPAAGRPNERVLCGVDGCGAQIGWIERAGVDSDLGATKPLRKIPLGSPYVGGPGLPYRDGQRVSLWNRLPVPWPAQYDFLVFRPGIACLDGVWQLSTDARSRAANRRRDIDRSGIGAHGFVGVSRITPDKLPARVICPDCRHEQVLSARHLRVRVLNKMINLGLGLP